MMRIRIRDDTLLSVALAILLTLSGCSGEPDASKTAENGKSRTGDPAARNLAWLGGTACALTESIAVPDPDNEDDDLYPGGLVVMSIEEGGRLKTATVRAGDIIVGVGGEMLPNTEDPTMDFIRLVEGEVSAEQSELTLQLVRNGKLQTVKTQIDLVPLERGLPLEVQRYAEQADRGLQFLLSQQQDDGSFSAASDDASATLIVSSLCGLALHADSDCDECQSAAQKCAEYVAAQVTDEAPVNPLTASYALMFLAESAPPPANMQPLGKCLKTIAASQQENGGWLTRGAEAGSEEANSDKTDSEEADRESSDAESVVDRCDLLGTFATNQILFALGVAERSGMMGDNASIEKAVAYLKSQAKARISSPIDRRIKAGLSAGTVAALNAVNVDRSDELVTRLTKETIRLAEEIPYSRALSVPHTLSAATLSRQSGVNTWIDHHRHAKLLVTQLQRSDGGFEKIVNHKLAPLELEIACDNDNWRTAHYCLLLQLQNPTMAAFAAEKSHPMLVARAGDGTPRKETAASGNPVPFSGGLKLDFDPTGMSPEELKEKMLEKLKAQGINIDGANVQIMTTRGEVPPASKPDDDD
jgi:hypothetical protein